MTLKTGCRLLLRHQVRVTLNYFLWTGRQSPLLFSRSWNQMKCWRGRNGVKRLSVFRIIYFVYNIFDTRASSISKVRHGFTLRSLTISPLFVDHWEKSKFHLLRHVSTRHARSCRARRACRAVLVPRWRTTKNQCSLLCSGFLSLSGTYSGKKVRWTCPPQSTMWRRPRTRVVRVALGVTRVSRCAVRQAWHCTSRLFPVPTCMG